MSAWQRAIRRVALALGLALLPAGAVRASDEVRLRRDAIGEDRVLFQMLLAEVRAECACDFGLENFYVGRFDLDDDGVDELLVLFGHSSYCGYLGCRTELFRKDRDGQWQDFTGITVAGNRGEGWQNYYYLRVEAERSQGFRTLRSVYHGLRWRQNPHTGGWGYAGFEVEANAFDDGFRPTTVPLLFAPEALGDDRDFLLSLRAKEQSLCGLPPAEGRMDVARRDLNGDGADELFVLFRGPCHCGTVGCEAGVFHRGPDAEWRELTRLWVGLVSRGEPPEPYRFYLEIIDSPVEKWRSFRSQIDGRRWSEETASGRPGYVHYRRIH